MSTPRRSSRIKAKEEDRLSKSASLRSKRKLSGRQQPKSTRNVVLDSSSEEEEACHDPTSEEEEEIDPSNLISPVTTKKNRPNNFLKVHSSYNFDRGGLDTYEKDFIDDTPFLTPRKHHPNYKRKRRTKRAKDSDEDDDRHSSASSDGVIGVRTRHTSDCKRRVLNASSSDSEGDTPFISSRRGDELKVHKEPLVKGEAQDAPTDSDDEEVNISVSSAKRRRKKVVSLNSDSDEENSDDDMKRRTGGTDKRKRRRLLKQPESDEEISMMEPLVRGSSGRAMKLRKEKDRERQKKLRRLKASRGVKGAEKKDLSFSDSQASDDNDEETPDEYAINDQEVDSIMKEAASLFTDIFTPAPTTAETILFPSQDEGSSEEEESDWIVSSGDSGEEIEDVAVVLAQLRKPTQPVVYHFEAGCRETEQCIVEGDDDDEEDSDGLVELDTSLPLHEILLGPVATVTGWKDGEKGKREEEEEEEEGEREKEVEREDGFAVAKLRKMLPTAKDKLDTVDSRGYTAVMVAADQGDSEALKLLLEAGANINCRDSNLTTPLHLAALSGWVECVDVLISRGHPVDCRDNQGWPPLLYAHFQDHHDCVLALMKANPKQLSVLRDLLRRTQHEDPEIRKRTVKVVRSLLMSLAHHETYYSIFNEFVSQNPSVLNEDGFSFMKHCMALLSFDNKQAWLRAKLKKLREYAGRSENEYSSGLFFHDLTRGSLLNAVRERVSGMTPAQCWIRPPNVSFKGEPGICTGPRREFWACLCTELANGGHRLFMQCDEGHISLQPCSIFSKYFSSALPRLVLEKHKQLLHSVGSLMACAVFHQDTLSLSLTKPLLKQLGGLSLGHPDDLQYVDQAFHHAMTVQLEDIDIADLELTFTQTLSCPWSGQTVDVAIREGGRACLVSQQNKEEYIKLVSQFKLETAVEQELEAFLSGFWEIIPQKCLNVFSPDELSLLISGVPSIDVEDWSRNTQYRGFSPSDDIVVWFWKLVHSLKEEEKALLLKFATGSPRAPAGGFSTLQGLGGPTKFQVCSMPGENKIPQASTCFNMLKLSDYSCEQELRNKILIAIRYGCEGFAFS